MPSEITEPGNRRRLCWILSHSISYLGVEACTPCHITATPWWSMSQATPCQARTWLYIGIPQESSAPTSTPTILGPPLVILSRDATIDWNEGDWALACWLCSFLYWVCDWCWGGGGGALYCMVPWVQGPPITFALSCRYLMCSWGGGAVHNSRGGQMWNIQS